MRLLGKTAVVLGIAGAMALGAMTPSEARNGRNAAIAAGAAGFVAGAAIGSAAASNSYYGPSYGYYEPSYGYDSYAYSPGYVSGSYYGPVEPYGYSYNTNSTGPWHERTLEGRDW